MQLRISAKHVNRILFEPLQALEKRRFAPSTLVDHLGHTADNLVAVLPQPPNILYRAINAGQSGEIRGLLYLAGVYAVLGVLLFYLVDTKPGIYIGQLLIGTLADTGMQ